MRSHLVAATAIAILAAGTTDFYAQPTQPVCRFDVDLFNRDRKVFGAPCCAECSGDAINCFPFIGHSIPWGNWGVDSNGGSRFNGDQFAGWCRNPGSTGCNGSSTSTWQWNSCRDQFPPPDSGFYNANGSSEQASAAPDVQLYANFDIVSNTDSTSGCAAFNGAQLILSGSFMEAWELDGCDEDERVGQLNYPGLTATRHCDFFQCGPDSSTWESPNGGDTGLLFAQISMTVSGIYDEEPIMVMLQPGTTDGPKTRHAARDRGRTRGLLSRLYSAFGRLPQLLPVPDLASATAIAATPWHWSQIVAQAAGSVVGRVVGPDGPIAGARVQVVNRRPGEFDVRTVITGKDGRFRLGDLEPGVREVLVVAAGYGRGKVEATVQPTVVAELEIRLERGGEISGLVVDRDGKPVPGARVVIRYPPEPRGKAPDRIRGDWHRGVLTTSEDGRFLVQDIQPNVLFTVYLEHATKGRKLVGSFNVSPGEALIGLIASWE